mgnify:FL=1
MRNKLKKMFIDIFLFVYLSSISIKVLIEEIKKGGK